MFVGKGYMSGGVVSGVGLGEGSNGLEDYFAGVGGGADFGGRAVVEDDLGGGGSSR